MIDDTKLPPMSDGARALLGEERGRVFAPVGAKARAFGRIATRIEGGAPQTPDARPPVEHAGAKVVAAKGGALATAAKLGITLAIGAALGAGTTLTMRPALPPATPNASASVDRGPAASPLPEQVPAPLASASTPPPPAVEPAPVRSSPIRQQGDVGRDSPAERRPLPIPSPSPELPTIPAGGSAGGTSATHSVVTDDAVARERAVVDRARAALGRNDPRAAIALAEAHERDFPNGQLGAERDAIWIRALVLANRKDEAAARATRFRATYPNSVFLPVVDAALAQPPR